MRDRTAILDWDEVHNPSFIVNRTHEGDRTMKKAIFAAIAVLGISLATGALAPAANAYTYLFPPCQNGG
jgi:hypothetical protein